jgi:tetratricopeptide (TPR) repeat protein
VDLATAYFDRGEVYLKTGGYDQAFDDFSRAIRLDPDRAGVYPDLAAAYYAGGEAYFKTGGYDQAITNFSRAIRFDPDLAGAYYYRGYVYFNRPKGASAGTSRHIQAITAWEKDRDYNLAIEDFEAALRIEPNHTLAGEMLELTRQALN